MHIQNVPVCTGTTRMCFNMCAWCRCTRGRFECTHGGVLDQHFFFGWTHGVLGEGVGVVVSLAILREKCFLIMFMSILTGCWVHLLSPIFCLPSMAHAELSRDPKVQSFAFSSLRIGREQHVPDSSNHSPCPIKLFNSRHMTQRHKKKRR